MDTKVNYDGKDLPSKSDQEQLNYDIKGPGDNKKSQVRLTLLQPLMQAVKLGSPSLVKLLLSKGADANVISQHNHTPNQTSLDVIM